MPLTILDLSHKPVRESCHGNSKLIECCWGTSHTNPKGNGGGYLSSSAHFEDFQLPLEEFGVWFHSIVDIEDQQLI